MNPLFCTSATLNVNPPLFPSPVACAAVWGWPEGRRGEGFCDRIGSASAAVCAVYIMYSCAVSDLQIAHLCCMHV